MIATQASSPPSFPSHFPSPTTTSTTTTSPPRTPRRPSMSNPMSWLGRTGSNTISSHGHSHSHSNSGGSTTMRISEPKLVNDMFTATGASTYTHPRYGVLGMGATVVRTPQDALARAMALAPQQHEQEVPGAIEEDDDMSSYEEDPEPVSPGSPPLPPLPFTSKSSPNLPTLSELGELRTPSPTRAKPTRPPPAVPQAQAQAQTRPVLKTLTTSPPALPAVPILPLNITPAPPQPPFAPISLTPFPATLLDLSSLIVTLETSTSSLRTTYATLTSRPSHLADYLESLARSAHEREKRKFRDTLVEEEEYDDEDDDDGHKLSSPNTPFQSLFAAHLTSVGLLPQTAGMIHLFLDRPSAPYAHILTYLRSPPEHPILPRAASLGSRQARSHDRLEALLELRDEAKYLGLEELHKLCCDELRQRQGHVRGGAVESNASSASGGSGNQVIVHERGRDAGLVRLGAITRREVKQNHMQDVERDSTGSFGHASAMSEVAHVEGVPISPSVSTHAPASVRTMSPSEGRVRRSRSHSRGNPRSASDWI